MNKEMKAIDDLLFSNDFEEVLKVQIKKFNKHFSAISYDEEKIPCLHFLLNDKKELMHDNQLIKVADFVSNKDIQLVISILKDKLPEELVKMDNIIVELSQESKLLKIEENI